MNEIVIMIDFFKERKLESLYLIQYAVDMELWEPKHPAVIAFSLMDLRIPKEFLYVRYSSTMIDKF